MSTGVLSIIGDFCTIVEHWGEERGRNAQTGSSAAVGYNFVLREHSIWSRRLRSQHCFSSLGRGQSTSLFALLLKFEDIYS